MLCRRQRSCGQRANDERGVGLADPKRRCHRSSVEGSKEWGRSLHGAHGAPGGSLTSRQEVFNTKVLSGEGRALLFKRSQDAQDTLDRQDKLLWMFGPLSDDVDHQEVGEVRRRTVGARPGSKTLSFSASQRIMARSGCGAEARIGMHTIRAEINSNYFGGFWN